MKFSELLWLLIHERQELRMAVTYKVFHDPLHDYQTNPGACYSRPTMKRCWELLDLTSRSFAAVIKELEGDLARAIAIFYVVLRALDTIEDDMTLDLDLKVPLLLAFHEKLYTPGWNFTQSGPDEKDRLTLVEFHTVIEEFQLLDVKYQRPIADITRKMGAGMAHYAREGAKRQNALFSLETKKDLDLYCHYVAGLVGEGLSGIFSASGLENPIMGQSLTLSNSMGLFLQKTNIMRDYREDVIDGRLFWPKEIWGQGGKISDPNELLDLEKNGQIAELALSEMIVDALAHTIDSLTYLSLLRNQSVFNFCAIPQVMAIATLDECFGNLDVFRRNVKIRRTHAASLILKATNPREVGIIFLKHLRSIHAKAKVSDPSFLKIAIILGRVEQFLEGRYPSWISLGRPLPSSAAEARSMGIFDVRTKLLSPASPQQRTPKSDDKAFIGIALGAAVLFLAMIGVPAVFGLWYFGAFANMRAQWFPAVPKAVQSIKAEL